MMVFWCDTHTVANIFMAPLQTKQLPPTPPTPLQNTQKTISTYQPPSPKHPKTINHINLPARCKRSHALKSRVLLPHQVPPWIHLRLRSSAQQRGSLRAPSASASLVLFSSKRKTKGKAKGKTGENIWRNSREKILI